MSSDLIIPFPPAKLARAAWAHLTGLLLLGLAGAAALAYYGYELHRLNAVVNGYQQAVFQYQMRTEAIDRLSDMEAAFNRYLLDGNSANTGLIESDKQRIEQLAQANADAQNDKLIQSLLATEQKWYNQAVQPMIEDRRKLAVGQGLPEDFLAKYRAVPQDLQIINFEMTAENAYHQAHQSLQQAEDQLRWRWIAFPLALLLAVGAIWLSLGAMRNVKHLKYAAENPEEEEDNEPFNNHEQTK